MGVSRRRLLALAAAIPAAIVAERGARPIAEVVAQAARGATLAARPAGSGTSATRCAQCGSAGHTMLDPGCPLAPRVLS